MKNYLVLTGAGISAESGIRTFRDSDGLWENHDVQEVATPEAFRRDPKLVWRFYKARYHQSLETSPNLGHYALVELEKHLGDSFHLITQNVDGLHRQAGSKRLIEMHGSLFDVFCNTCKKYYRTEEIDLEAEIPLCSCGGYLRPDIVWFGEVPYKMDEIDVLLRRCEVLMVVGTSGAVYPAAGFVNAAKYFGARTVAVNLAEPDNLRYIDEYHQGKAGEILPKLVEEILKEDARSR